MDIATLGARLYWLSGVLVATRRSAVQRGRSYRPDGNAPRRRRARFQAPSGLEPSAAQPLSVRREQAVRFSATTHDASALGLSRDVAKAARGERAAAHPCLELSAHLGADFLFRCGAAVLYHRALAKSRASGCRCYGQIFGFGRAAH